MLICTIFSEIMQKQLDLKYKSKNYLVSVLKMSIYRTERIKFYLPSVSGYDGGFRTKIDLL